MRINTTARQRQLTEERVETYRLAFDRAMAPLTTKFELGLLSWLNFLLCDLYHVAFCAARVLLPGHTKGDLLQRGRNGMLGTVLLFGFLAGIDNLQASSAIGVLPLRRARKHLLATAFTVCETTAPLAGLGLGHFLLLGAGSAGAKIAPFAMLACGIAILLCAFRQEDASSLVNGPKIVFGLPMTLSFDNLLAGAGISSLHYPVVISALLIGLVSAAMSCIGLYLGAWIRRFIPSRTEFVAGAYLCILAGRALSDGGA